MGKAKKLPSGNWRARAKVNGITRSFTAADKRTAELMAMQWQAGKQEENRIGITLSEAYERYISAKERVLSPSTIKCYHSMHRNTFQSIMGMKISDLNSVMVQREISNISASHQPKYVRNAYSLLTAVMDMFAPDVSLRVSLPQKKKTEMYIPDDNDVAILIKASEGTNLEIPILLAAFGPMRRGEICALTSDDVEGNIVTVNKSMVLTPQNKWEIKSPKTYSSYRNITYPDFVIDKIKGKKGRIVDMTPFAITDAFPVLLKRAGLPHFRFHDLRHYAVSTLHAQNIPDKYIQARGGWQTNYTMNNVYNHIIKNKKDETEDKIISHFTQVFDKK